MASFRICWTTVPVLLHVSRLPHFAPAGRVLERGIVPVGDVGAHGALAVHEILLVSLLLKTCAARTVHRRHIWRHHPLHGTLLLLEHHPSILLLAESVGIHSCTRLSHLRSSASARWHGKLALKRRSCARV